MQSSLRSDILTDFVQLEQLAPEWERLWQSSPQREIFTKWSWLRPWWRAYGQQRSLCTPVVFQGSRLIGVLPLAIEQRTLRFMGTPGADYSDMLCEDGSGPAVLEMALEALYARQASWDHCRLDNVADTSQIVAHITHLPKRLRARLRLAFHSPCTRLAWQENDDVLMAVLRKKSLRRHHNALRKMGTVTFRHVEDGQEIKHHLPAFFWQHITRSATTASVSLFTRQEARGFYTAMVEELDPCTELRFALLELDGRPVAYHLGFEDQRKFIWYKPTFDVNLWKHSPGEVLIRYLFEYVATRGLREFDFTCGDEAFKERFANRVSQNYSLHLYPAGLRGQVHALPGRVYERVKQQLKPYVHTFPRATSLLSRAKSLYTQCCRTWRYDGIISGSKNLLTQIWRMAVLAHDEVLVFSGARPAPPMLSDDITVHPGTLAELAALSVAHPHFITVTMLRQALGRLSHGDTLYLVRQAGHLLHVLWIGQRSTLMASEVGAACYFLQTPVSLLYDHWRPPDVPDQGLHPTALWQLLAHLPNRPEELWISCHRNDVASQLRLQEAGFCLRHRLGYMQILHWWQRTWIE